MHSTIRLMLLYLCLIQLSLALNLRETIRSKIYVDCFSRNAADCENDYCVFNGTVCSPSPLSLNAICTFSYCNDPICMWGEYGCQVLPEYTTGKCEYFQYEQYCLDQTGYCTYTGGKCEDGILIPSSGSATTPSMSPTPAPNLVADVQSSNCCSVAQKYCSGKKHRSISKGHLAKECPGIKDVCSYYEQNCS